MGFSLCGIPVGHGYVKALRISGVEDLTWQGRVVDRKPTALPCGDGRNRRMCCPDYCRGACLPIRWPGYLVDYNGLEGTVAFGHATRNSEGRDESALS